MSNWTGNSSIIGPALALTTAALWAVSPMFMASAGRRVGSFPVVLIRSALATLLLTISVGAVSLFYGFPPTPSLPQAGWLALSGLLGMGIGDVLIYESFVLLGPRRTTQTLVLAPVVAVTAGWLWLDEVMQPTMLIGIAIILGSTFYAILARQRQTAPLAGGESGDVRPSGEPGRVSAVGIVFAVAGALCMGLGAVAGRRAFVVPGPPLEGIFATLIRVASAGLLLWFVPLLRGKAGTIAGILRDSHVRNRVLVGTFLGPFIGMYCYMSALQTTQAGLVSTLVATSPLFAIPITMLRYRARIGWDVWLAAVIAVIGVGLLCNVQGLLLPLLQ